MPNRIPKGKHVFHSHWWCKKSTFHCRRHRKCVFNPWVRKIPCRRKGQPTPAFLPAEPQGQRSLVGYCSQGHKELDTTEQISRHERFQCSHVLPDACHVSIFLIIGHPGSVKWDLMVILICIFLTISVFFWNSLAFSMIQGMLAIWSLVPLPFLNPAWTSGSSRFTYCWSLACRILSITLLVCEMSAIVQ